MGGIHRHLAALEPGWRLQLAVAGLFLLAAAVVRLTLDRFFPGVLPFALLFPAILVATLIAGRISGAIVTGAGALYAWAVAMDHPFLRPGAPATAVDAINLVLYLAAAAAIIACAEVQRGQTRRIAAQEAARLEARDRSVRELRQVFRNAPGFMAIVRGPDHVFEFANLAYQRLVGRTDLEGKPLVTAIPEFPQALIALLDQVRSTGEPHVGQGVRITLQRSPDAPQEVRYLDFVLQPILGADRQVEHIYLEGFDATETVRNQTALRESEARLRLAADAARMAIWEQHPTQGFIHTETLNTIFGSPPGSRLTVEELQASYLPGELERVRALTRAAYARGERNTEVEYRFRRRDGVVRWVLVRAEMMLNRAGQPRGALGVAMDITERKDSEERVKLLAREVDHRANNLLTVMLGTVRLSVAPTVEALRTVLLGRIAALSRAHQLLSEARWQGADLRRLVEEELLGYSLGDATRAALSGPDVALSPAAAQALAMALHELATNAAKHGALSVPEGSVDLSWTRPKRGPLILTWTESGGPEVHAPTRRGLGTTILERALSGALGGTTRLHWNRSGLVCELELPLEALEAGPI